MLASKQASKIVTETMRQIARKDECSKLLDECVEFRSRKRTSAQAQDCHVFIAFAVSGATIPSFVKKFGQEPQEDKEIRVSLMTARILSLVSSCSTATNVAFYNASHLDTQKEVSSTELLKLIKDGSSIDQDFIKRIMGSETVLCAPAEHLITAATAGVYLQLIAEEGKSIPSLPITASRIGVPTDSTCCADNVAVVTDGKERVMLAGVLVVEALLSEQKGSISCEVEIGCNAKETGVAQKKKEINIFNIFATDPNGTQKTALVYLTNIVYPNPRQEITLLNPLLYPVYEIRDESISYTYYLSNSQDVSKITIASKGLKDGISGTVEGNQVFPQGTIPKSNSVGYYPLPPDSWIKSSVYDIAKNDTNLTESDLVDGSPKHYKKSVSMDYPLVLVISGTGETAQRAFVVKKDNLGGRINTMPTPLSKEMGAWAVSSDAAAMTYGTEDMNISMAIDSISYRGTLTAIGNIAYLSSPPAVNEECAVRNEITVTPSATTTYYVVPTLILDTTWTEKAGMPSGETKWTLSNLSVSAIVKNHVVQGTEPVSLEGSTVEIKLATTSITKFSSMPDPLFEESTTFTTGVWSSTMTDGNASWNWTGSSWERNGFAILKKPLLEHKFGTQADETAEAALPTFVHGGNLFLVTKQALGIGVTNAFSISIDDASIEGKFTIDPTKDPKVFTCPSNCVLRATLTGGKANATASVTFVVTATLVRNQ